MSYAMSPGTSREPVSSRPRLRRQRDPSPSSGMFTHVRRPGAGLGTAARMSRPPARASAVLSAGTFRDVSLALPSLSSCSEKSIVLDKPLPQETVTPASGLLIKLDMLLTMPMAFLEVFSLSAPSTMLSALFTLSASFNAHRHSDVALSWRCYG